MLQGMQNIEYVQIEENRSLIRKILVKFAKIVPIKKFISQATVKRGLDKELKKYKSDDTWLISNYMGTYHERETFPIEFFGKGKKIKFEDDYMCYKIDERNVQINEGTN